MPLHLSYKAQLDNYLAIPKFKSLRAPAEPTVAMAQLLLDGRVTVAAELEEILRFPLEEQHAQVIPSQCLTKAVSAALLGKSPSEYLQTGLGSVGAARTAAIGNVIEHRVLGDAVCIAAWLRDASVTALLTEWLRTEPEEIDVSVVDHCRRFMIQSGSPGLCPDAVAMLALRSLTCLDRHRFLATLLMDENHDVRRLLLEGREQIDKDLFDNREMHPRVAFSVSDWELSKGQLRRRVVVEGTGGPIAAVGPFVEPLYDCAHQLERLIAGDYERPDVAGIRSKRVLADALADSAQTIVIDYLQPAIRFIDPSAIHRFDSVVNSVTEWLRVRHGDAFRAKVVIGESVRA